MDSRIDRTKLNLPILMETAHEMAVVKPAGMATELSRDPKGTSLLSRTKAALPTGSQPKLPHRLDRVSRGIVIMALTKDAIAYHNQQIQQRAWDKIYLARCLAPADREPDALLGQHKLHLRPQGGRARVVRSGGRQALTEIIALAPVPGNDGEIHVLIRLLTGRFHQIRATLAHLGSPLVDDWIYGTSPGRGKERFYLEHIALRFIPFESAAPCIVHWTDDPDRELVDPKIGTCLDQLLTRWENEGAIRMGGHHA
ncbi:pseudouridine synthase [Candidatus Bipolaricaulota bacterium]